MTLPLDVCDSSINLSTRAELLEAIDGATHEVPVRIVTPNPEIILTALKYPRLSEALQDATHAIVDGYGLYVYLRLKSLRDKRLRKHLQLYHGADCVADLFNRYPNGEKSFYILGGAPGMSGATVKAILSKYPGLRILDAENGGQIDPGSDRISEPLATRIKAANPDILLVGFGAPKQEIWIQKAKAVLDVPVMLGIGGSLDFYVAKPRAPRWMRSLHLEWLYRLFHERGHWRRIWRALILFPLAAAAWELRSVRRQPRSSGRSHS